jgi:dienelactone hydrolase
MSTIQKRLLSSLHSRCNLPLLHYDPSPTVVLNRVARRTVEANLSLPAIIVLQERWSVDDQIKSFSQTIADGAMASCVLPDLYGSSIQGI